MSRIGENTDVVDTLLAKGKLADAVVELVRIRQYVSFVEIITALEPHIEVKGDVAITLSGHPNIILWIGSGPFVELMRELIADHRIYQHPCEVLIYMIDGLTLSLPVPRSKRALKSKKDYWAPVTFCTYPHPTSPFYDKTKHPSGHRKR